MEVKMWIMIFALQKIMCLLHNFVWRVNRILFPVLFYLYLQK